MHPCANEGNSVDKLRQTRSVAYSVEIVLNKRQISGGGAYLDCYPNQRREAFCKVLQILKDRPLLIPLPHTYTYKQSLT